MGAVDESDAERLVQLGVRPNVIEVTGDTRFDQVWQRAESVDPQSRLQSHLASDRPTIVAGSTWPSDEAPLLEAFEQARARVPSLRLIIAPHELRPEHLTSIEHWAQQNHLTLARVDAASSTADIVLVDRFGVLGELYALADAAFVGGGFHDAGLHSVLEPAAFGAPVVFGPRHARSRDAVMLLGMRAARSVTDATDLLRVLLEWFQSADARREAGARAKSAVERGRGAAARSLALVERLLA